MSEGSVPDSVTDRESAGLPELVAAAQSGDAAAFEKLYRQHVGKVYAICLRLIAEPVKAETLTQDVFVRAWQKLSSFAGTGSFPGWLSRLAVNVVLEDRRVVSRRRQIMEPLPDQLDSGSAGRDPDPERYRGSVPQGGTVAPAATEIGIDLERAVAGLPPGARTAFVLHDVQGFRHQEIAEMMGLATGTVKAQLHRARMLLRQTLGDRREVGEA
ncbi:MAG: RNA polymerase sigma factor [bacterium]